MIATERNRLMLRPMTLCEGREGQFYRVSGPNGHADFLPDGRWVRLVRSDDTVTAMPLERGVAAAKVLAEHAEPGLRQLLNRCYDELTAAPARS